MPRRSDKPDQRKATREKLIGLGERSIRKSYYPQLQERLHELERFRALLDQSNDAIFLADARTGAFFDCNETAARMLGCLRKELAGRTVADVFAPLAARRILDYLRTPAAHSVFMATTEARLEAAQAKARPGVPVEVSVRVVELENSAYGVLAARDITERLHAERALAASEAKYRSIFENALEGVFQTTPDGSILDANRAMAELAGFDSPEQFMAECANVAPCIYEHPEDRALLVDTLMKSGEIKNFETRFKRRDGEVIWVSINARVARRENGEVDHFEGSFLDITARKRLEEREQGVKEQLRKAVRDRTHALLAKTRELKEANRRLRELDEMKSAFLSSVSHELRTPLTSILGFAKLINRDLSGALEATLVDAGLQGKKARRIVQNLAIIQNEGERLTRLINDFLDLSKIESGKLEWRDRMVRPAELLEEVAQAASGLFAQNPEVRLESKLADELPVLRVDADRVKQVLLNLLNNAYKFTPRGVVRLEAEAGAAALVVRVRDSGVGIPPQDLEKIFNKFHQVRSSDTLQDKPRGTGLGLAISRQIVRHYGGTIQAESTPGQGSVFTVTLPRACQCNDRTVEQDRARFTPDRPVVLVVDDDPAVSSYLAQVLESAGYNVATAGCGESALHKARNLAPDLVTMDLLMPGLDGRDAIAALRREPETSRMPILVISVLQDTADAGGDAALTKPVDAELLLDTVTGLLSDKRPRAPMLALRTNGKTDLGNYFALCEGCISHCTEVELWERIAKGFQGTVIVPAPSAGRDIVSRLRATPNVNVLLLPEHPV
ncbi:MAG: PAS domain S-box protein [Desulfovibrionaceae bacterium]|jgi:PAS domain S-box-containing protein|nr:PAS domain S-box protein [Desulfovibrionaceae bacterium]